MDTIGTFHAGQVYTADLRQCEAGYRRVTAQSDTNEPYVHCTLSLKLSTALHVNVTIVDLIKRHRGQSLQPGLLSLLVSEGSREMSRTVVYRH